MVSASVKMKENCYKLWRWIKSFLTYWKLKLCPFRSIFYKIVWWVGIRKPKQLRTQLPQECKKYYKPEVEWCSLVLEVSGAEFVISLPTSLDECNTSNPLELPVGVSVKMKDKFEIRKDEWNWFLGQVDGHLKAHNVVHNLSIWTWCKGSEQLCPK